MICLTGDLHHSGLRTGNQLHCDITELQTARPYLAMLEEAGVKATLFLSGRCFAEEWEDVRPLVEHPLVEIGGHNWSCLTPVLWHRICNKLLGSYNGPAWYQRRDVLRTMREIRRRTGRTIRSWRNHMYMHGPHTERVLKACGIPICSDGVRRDSRGPVLHPAGIWNLPINVIPDHEHLYHAERTPQWVQAWVQRYQWSDDFGPESYPVGEWVELVLEGLRHNEERGALSTLIIHPITMYLCDRFEGFGRILDFLAKQECVHVDEVLEAARAARPQPEEAA
ncbi:MAG: polysaccharide deacetylase family protein [Planctomycetota bacterium]